MEKPVLVTLVLAVKAVRAEGETDAELVQRLQSTSEWEDWDVLSAQVRK